MTSTMWMGSGREGVGMKVTASVWIDRPVGEVYALIATPAHDPLWREGLLKMSADQPGPVQDGMITTDVLKFLGTVHTTRCVVSQVREGRSYQFRSVEGATAVRGSRLTVAEAGGTRFVSTLELGLTGALRLASPLLKLLYWQRSGRELARLKRHLEGQPAQPRSPLASLP
ncbi:SRPBCC family protein (plasmid) [Deinococcus sp. D7000]|nr:SRPBCC family protein [Deinococcus sp. D7000]